MKLAKPKPKLIHKACLAADWVGGAHGSDFSLLTEEKKIEVDKNANMFTCYLLVYRS
jgi:hypothetical protein